MLRFGTSFVFLLAVVALLFTRFGTSVPEPAPTPIDSQLLVQKIVKSIHCEISNAITYVIDSDKALAVAFNKGIIPLTQVREYANLQIIGDSNDPQARSSEPSRNQAQQCSAIFGP
jgi:hypothetical protein